MSVAIAGALMLPAPAAADPPDHAKGRGSASFEERHLDLEEDWGEATVCLVHDGGDTTECFRTVEEADAAQERIDREASADASKDSTSDSEAAAQPDDGSLRLQAAYASSSGSCGSWLSLSDGTYDSGRTLRFRDRGYVQDLASYGFAYATSSYTTGACSVTMYDASWSVYPGNTTAWTDANWMQPGWDNRVRRIYIH